MTLKRLPQRFSICKLKKMPDVAGDIFFLARTDEEISLVCQTSDVPRDTVSRDDGWRGFRIEGQLDFSLVGILSKLSAILADNHIGIFAVSTYNTDYILVKNKDFGRALEFTPGTRYVSFFFQPQL